DAFAAIPGSQPLRTRAWAPAPSTERSSRRLESDYLPPMRDGIARLGERGVDLAGLDPELTGELSEDLALDRAHVFAHVCEERRDAEDLTRVVLLRDRLADHLDAAVDAVFFELIAQVVHESGDLIRCHRATARSDHDLLEGAPFVVVEDPVGIGDHVGSLDDGLEQRHGQRVEARRHRRVARGAGRERMEPELAGSTDPARGGAERATRARRLMRASFCMGSLVRGARVLARARGKSIPEPGARYGVGGARSIS